MPVGPRRPVVGHQPALNTWLPITRESGIGYLHNSRWLPSPPALRSLYHTNSTYAETLLGRRILAFQRTVVRGLIEQELTEKTEEQSAIT